MAAADERQRARPEYGLGNSPSAYRKLANGSLRILPFAEIDAKVRSGAYQYHPFPRGFVLTQVTQYDSERVLDVVLLWGDQFDAWKADVVNHLIEFGRANGCAAVEAIARLGLGKTLKPLGWRRKKILLRKEIT
jgi:hypothetical protein